jgi:signal transduction histidine kinase
MMRLRPGAPILERMLERLRNTSERPEDGLLAAVVLVVTEAGVWLQAEVPGGKPLAAAALGVAAIALVGRRRRPLAVAIVVAAANALPVVVALEASQGGTAFVALLVAVYSVGRHAATSGAVAGWAVTAAATVVDALLYAGEHNLDTATWQTTVVTVAWLVGLVFRVRGFREAELRDRAVRLERERDEKARAAALDERARIARELHDVIAHNVSVIAVQSGAALEVLASRPEAARPPLLAIETTARRTLAEMRLLLGILRTRADGDALVPQPDLGQLSTLVDDVSRSGLSVDLHVEGEPAELEAGLAVSAYRIVQEALTNVLKHANATRADVVVRYGTDALEVEVRDDGSQRANVAGDGHGLIGMQERVSLYGGDFHAGPRPEGGFEVRARLPLDPAAR